MAKRLEEVWQAADGSLHGSQATAETREITKCLARALRLSSGLRLNFFGPCSHRLDIHGDGTSTADTLIEMMRLEGYEIRPIRHDQTPA